MRKQILMTLVLLFCTILSGCGGSSADTAAVGGIGCTSGDCLNGWGEFHQPDGKFVKVSQGTFKDGNLWNGKVNLMLANKDELLVQEVVDGKIIWQRPYGH